MKVHHHAVRHVRYRYWGWEVDIVVPNEFQSKYHHPTTMRSAMSGTDMAVDRRHRGAKSKMKLKAKSKMKPMCFRHPKTHQNIGRQAKMNHHKMPKHLVMFHKIDPKMPKHLVINPKMHQNIGPQAISIRIFFLKDPNYQAESENESSNHP